MKEKNKYKILWIIITLIGTVSIIVLVIAGCSNESPDVSDVGITVADSELFLSSEHDCSDAESIAEIYCDIYEDAVEKNTSGSLEVIRSIVNRLGENGYSAVDGENQIDMVCPEQIKQFCGQVEAQEEAEATLIVVISAISFVKYEFTTKDGNVEVLRNYYLYKEDDWETMSTKNYPVYTWIYSGEGYLFFEEYHMPGFDGPSRHTAIRIEPLDEMCRELNRKYVRAIGYELNNLFTSDWNEDDFQELNFYDLYEVLHQMNSERYAALFLNEGENYEIPKSEFESVFQAFFRIDGQVLQQYTTYHEDTETYQYKTRGMFDFAPTPYIPYPEVISYEENQDGTIKLTVNAVSPEENLEKAFCHEVIIRPLEDGGFQYVSNHIIPSEDNVAITWYTERLSDDKWQEYYGGKERKSDIDRQIEKGYDLPADASQREEAENDCKKMMELIRDIYVPADKGDALNVVLSDETVFAMQNKLKETKSPVITTGIYSNMENFESVDNFLKECMERISGSAVMYEIHSDGGIERMKFIFDGTDMYVLSMAAIWDKENEPEISHVSYTRIKEWKYTDKGWFCYEVCAPEYPEVTETVDGSCMLRVKPMTDKNREMSEKCILGLAYQGNNILCSNWDMEHMEDLDYNGLYEYLYAMKYEKKFDSENCPGGIPKEEFEELIMEYFPITKEDIQKYAVFDEKNQTYAWERLGWFNYSPTFFGTSIPEVTHIRENEDGTVTLTVDAVCEMILCDDAVITHELTVRFSEDGSFQYLGNKILDDGIMDIPEYQYRINRE